MSSDGLINSTSSERLSPEVRPGLINQTSQNELDRLAEEAREEARDASLAL